MEEEAGKRRSVNINAIIFLATAAALIFVLVGMLTYRLLAEFNRTEIDGGQSEVIRESKEDGQFVSDYFEDRFTDESSEDSFLENDPFVNQCEGAPGGAVSFGTICIREE